MKRAVQFWTKAAMQGDVLARNNLGAIENRFGFSDRALKHLLISAKMGFEVSVDLIKTMMLEGNATKEQYNQALKGYQDAVEEMNSHDRDEAKREVKLGY